MNIRFPLLLASTALSATALAAPTILVHETFTRTDASIVRSTAISPTPGPVTNWIGSPGFTALNNTLKSATTGTGHTLSADMGVDYFVNNPGIYTLTADVFFHADASASTKNWQIGFNNLTNTSAGANRTLLSTDTLGGSPAIALRGNGQVVVKGPFASAAIYTGVAGTYPAGSTYNLKLVLDTQPAQWTFDALINDVAIDLNGAAAGTAYTFAVNPTIRYATISSNLNSTDNGTFANHLDNFQLTVIPEPGTLALTGLAALALLLFRRRG